MTLRQLAESMDVAELRKWMAFHRYFDPLGQEYFQTCLIASAVVAPYTKGSPPDPRKLMPVMQAPMTAEEIGSELAKLKRPSDGKT
jgi:hypothetical protein